MKRVLRLATTLALALGMAATSFAVVNPSAKLKPTDTMGQQTTRRKPRQSSRHGAKRIGYNRQASALRVRRLTERQRRDFYRMLLWNF